MLLILVWKYISYSVWCALGCKAVMMSLMMLGVDKKLR